MSLTFSSNSARDRLDALRHKADEFRGDPVNEQLAMDYAVLAWSLCDWVFREHGQKLGYQALGDLQRYARRQCPELGYLQDLATAAKHKEVTKYTPKIRAARKHGGSFSRSFSRSFNVSRLVLETDQGTEHWLDDLIPRELLSYKWSLKGWHDNADRPYEL